MNPATTVIFVVDAPLVPAQAPTGSLKATAGGSHQAEQKKSPSLTVEQIREKIGTLESQMDEANRTIARIWREYQASLERLPFSHSTIECEITEWSSAALVKEQYQSRDTFIDCEEKIKALEKNLLELEG